MTTPRGAKRAAALDRIKRNIDAHGFHFYVVTSRTAPRYAYTIGLTDSGTAELVLAGAIIFMADEVRAILNAAVREVFAATPAPNEVVIEGHGRFGLKPVHRSWIKALMLGALDYYGQAEINALQLVPDREHWTIDVPDMTMPWNLESEPAWQCLRAAWPYPVPQGSDVVTDLDALRGSRITQVYRSDEDGWEMFSAPHTGVTREQARVVPMACLIGRDPSLLPAISLGVGQGIWRESDGPWHIWDHGPGSDDPLLVLSKN